MDANTLREDADRSARAIALIDMHARDDERRMCVRAIRAEAADYRARAAMETDPTKLLELEAAANALRRIARTLEVA